MSDIPAFPSSTHPDYFSSFGMSLRDYFAIHASEKDIEDFYKFPPDFNGRVSSRTRSQARYAFADEMLRERSK